MGGNHAQSAKYSFYNHCDNRYGFSGFNSVFSGFGL
jgi:hypothetical protein